MSRTSYRARASMSKKKDQKSYTEMKDSTPYKETMNFMGQQIGCVSSVRQMFLSAIMYWDQTSNSVPRYNTHKSHQDFGESRVVKSNRAVGAKNRANMVDSTKNSFDPVGWCKKNPLLFYYLLDYYSKIMADLEKIFQKHTNQGSNVVSMVTMKEERLWLLTYVKDISRLSTVDRFNSVMNFRLEKAKSLRGVGNNLEHNVNRVMAEPLNQAIVDDKYDSCSDDEDGGVPLQQTFTENRNNSIDGKGSDFNEQKPSSSPSSMHSFDGNSSPSMSSSLVVEAKKTKIPPACHRTIIVGNTIPTVRRYSEILNISSKLQVIFRKMRTQEWERGGEDLGIESNFGFLPFDKIFDAVEDDIYQLLDSIYHVSPGGVNWSADVESISSKSNSNPIFRMKIFINLFKLCFGVHEKIMNMSYQRLQSIQVIKGYKSRFELAD